MAHVHVSPRLITIDDVDVTEHVRAWNIEGRGRDVPTIVLELTATGKDLSLFDGVANVRTTTDAMTVSEFLDGIDPAALEQMILEGDMTRGPAATMLDILRGWARGV